MHIFVFGSNGQVGKALVSLLEQQTEFTFDAFDRQQCDVTDEQKVRELVLAKQPDIIINATAYTAVDKAEDEPEKAFLVNEKGALCLALAAKEVNALLLHISTDYVFDGESEGEYNESDIVNPSSVYGDSKLAGERAIAGAWSKHITLRTAWVFGEHGQNFVKTMLRLAENRDELGIVNDQFGGPTYAGDIAAALVRLAYLYSKKELDLYGIYHFSGQPFVSWFEFAEEIFNKALEHEVLEAKPILNKLTSAQFPTKAKRPKNSRLSLQKIGKDFSISPSDWQKALDNITLYK
ncbi:dTDP-4-dehydrorhamnose reductase [bacterium 19CA01SA08]|uniref:dTDP-4-dehydrorhamnose reductase n=1 Tax=bacterium 19CA01SA08 TaxID=2920574 RepID=A0AAU6VQ33_UNCXX